MRFKKTIFFLLIIIFIIILTKINLPYTGNTTKINGHNVLNIYFIFVFAFISLVIFIVTSSLEEKAEEDSKVYDEYDTYFLDESADNIVKNAHDKGYNSLVFLDRGARVFSYLIKERWKILYPKEKIPEIKYANIGREKANKGFSFGRYWGFSLKDEEINELRRAFTNKKTGKNFFDGKKVLIIDDYCYFGSTINFARKIFQKSFPEAEKIGISAIASAHQYNDHYEGTEIISPLVYRRRKDSGVPRTGLITKESDTSYYNQTKSKYLIEPTKKYSEIEAIKKRFSKRLKNARLREKILPKPIANLITSFTNSLKYKEYHKDMEIINDYWGEAHKESLNYKERKGHYPLLKNTRDLEWINNNLESLETHLRREDRKERKEYKNYVNELKKIGRREHNKQEKKIV